jgi:hypothetical protein
VEDLIADLITFFRARLDERAERAERASELLAKMQEGYRIIDPGLRNGIGYALSETGYNPDEELADLDNKRHIIAELEHSLVLDPHDPDVVAGATWLYWCVRHLALQFAGHPDYRAEWKP